MSGRPARAAVWLPGLAVAVGAAIATAHGLYEVAVAARVPSAIAWLYPLITDGLALVAYAATPRLAGKAARYAWAVVVIAAGLSGLAQATFLAGGPAVEVAPALRFGVGAWPAVAGAVVAHLLYLLAIEHPDPDAGVQSVQPIDEPYDGRAVHEAGVQTEPYGEPAVQASTRPSQVQPEIATPLSTGASVARPSPSPARDRAEAAATRHAQHFGAWPTVSELEVAAEVSRGTAAAVLKTLRQGPLPLHLITAPTQYAENEANR